jgi:calcineurin-like phosphoesterase family protein
MVRRWNERVKKEDIVIHLGDFSLGRSKETINIANRLNGNKILIKGNHDKSTGTFWQKRAGFKKYFNRGFVEISDDLILSHRPKRIEGVINLHGHVHNNLSRYHSVWCTNLSVEVWDYYPVNLNEIEFLSHDNKKKIRDFFSSYISWDLF